MNILIGRGILLRRLAVLLLLIPFLSNCKSTNPYDTKAVKQHREAQRALDETQIQNYLTTNNIKNYTRTNSGLYLISVADGTGDLIKSGQRAQVQYIGRTLNDGLTFDSSYDNRTPCQCIDVLVGSGAVITGWDEGLQLMRKGDSKILIIPSELAYGFSGDGIHNPPAAIGNDRVLLFEMKVTNVQ
ncbi:MULTISPECIES: FKBP-type peptidyl-prolyl cis-trans isomerase [Hymenobacter]|nr:MULTISPECIES: FKBP-type peptidyl-prolyl cis-trans isomerase [Hymenobacter]MBC6992464.1 FKBP-type peptidyl-prolyl cis-trans isomerase [Hymenobacter sp. BT491]